LGLLGDEVDGAGDEDNIEPFAAGCKLFFFEPPSRAHTVVEVVEVVEGAPRREPSSRS
jgi:hypothetical protein